jgi:capsular polysaccharide biosynthesis protein
MTNLMFANLGVLAALLLASTFVLRTRYLATTQQYICHRTVSTYAEQYQAMQPVYLY